MIYRKSFFAFLFIMMAFNFSFSSADEVMENITISFWDSDGNQITDVTSNFTSSSTLTGTEDAVLLTMSFVGDITIGTNTQYKGISIFEKELKRQDGNIHFAFKNVKKIFEVDDLTMANFEGTLTTAGKNPTKLDNAFLFRADPSYVKLLSENGIETVSLENNHVMDMGSKGLIETKSTLLNAGITYACEDEPAFITAKGVKIGSLAYQTFNGRHDELIRKVPNDIKKLRDAGCKIVIVSYHWGKEKDTEPNQNQIRLGRATIDAGADLVIGHHSHRVNPIEYYHERYICYSLGNFCFAGNNKPDDMSTYIFQVQFLVKNDMVTSEKIKIIPCRISSNTQYNDFIPTPYTNDDDIKKLIKKLIYNSQHLKYAIKHYPLSWDK